MVCIELVCSTRCLYKVSSSICSAQRLRFVTTANIEEPGEVEDCLLMCRDQYNQHKEEMIAKGRKRPVGEGALIIDEVKVHT